MTNNKQSSVELFIEQLEEKGKAWENVSIRRVQISIDVSEYMELKQQAKAMHKEEVIDFAMKFMMQDSPVVTFYNETFNNNEQH